ncbi:unnamed protein product [Caenorhabditis auriculariae]|uniref:DIX domain-containing protein n=1 Tax=Caenorhabditis auriculariae TaxID=2777116 RepID=A0A8S1GLW2_9PELO|nr:unnamed protein product [Caenorhabditis auriculariae]
MDAEASHLSWARGLEYVLSDRPALDAFRDWLVDSSATQYLDLYFAARAYERMALEFNPKTLELARSIYSMYISMRTGLCDRLPSKLRSHVGERVKMMTTATECEPTLFSQCSSFAEDILRRHHQQFVCSDEFIDAFNHMFIMENPSSNSNTIDKRHSNTWRRSSAQSTTLTAEALMRSRHNRQTTLGESKLEKMFPNVVRQPYVCNATTSQNDSAVSSSFSSDTGKKSSRLRHVKEEQLRGNPISLVVPRVENSSKNESKQFDHSTEDGRRQFAYVLSKKLSRLIETIERNDETERQINDIEQCRYTMLDVVSTTDAARIDFDEDEDLDDYVRRMRDDSLRASANRSPPAVVVASRTFSPTKDLPSAIQMTTSSYGTARSAKKSSAFAPPPQNLLKFDHSYSKNKDRNRSHMYDSSGIGSMAPSTFSELSEPLSRKSTGSSSALRHRPSPGAYSARKPKKLSSNSSAPLITISYKGSDGVPIVAHVSHDGPMTLRDFRRYFSISSNGSAPFFFKAECEDGSAPYQLLLVSDDSQFLPVFQGKISAEVKGRLPD